MRQKAVTTYFLGAGASAADGVPVTGQLNFGIAAYLSDETRGDALRTYYSAAFGVGKVAIRRDAVIWDAFLSDSGTLESESALPNLIETLSLLDVNIVEGRSLGPKKSVSNRASVELSNALLRSARSELVEALRLAIVQVISKRGRIAKATEAFTKALRPSDSILTTNWDYVIEKVLAKAQKRLDGGWLKTRTMEFGCIGERVVDWRGKDLTVVRGTCRAIFKLHGGVNWYLCERCQNLYINVEYTPASLRDLTQDSGGCHCGAELSGLIVAPSYLKDYNNPHLKSVWVHAQKALESSNKWVFIGYSLPQDDYHIRALLLRALCVRRAKRSGGETQVVVVTSGKPGESTTKATYARYRDFFRMEEPLLETGGFRKYLGIAERSTTGKR